MKPEIRAEDIYAFLDQYAGALARFDAEGSADLWGIPGMIITDEFAGALHSREEMAEGLRRAYPLYRQLGLADVRWELLERVAITAKIVRLRIRWSFLDATGALLTRADGEYTLRKDVNGLHVYFFADIDEQERVRELIDQQRSSAERTTRIPDVDPAVT